MPFTYDYPRPALTVDAAIFNKEEVDIKVLLIKRKHFPYEGMWALPGGFVDMDETLEQAIHRELMEETGLKCIKLQQLHTYGAIDRDPRGRTVSVVFWGLAGSNQKVVAGDDAKEAEWFSIQKLPKLAFDHAAILEMAIQKMTLSIENQREFPIFGP